MHIVVCLKQVLDPEITPRYFQIDPETNRPEDEARIWSWIPLPKMRLEAAIQLRDKTWGNCDRPLSGR